MAILKIYTDDASILREKSKPVLSFTKEIKKLINDMRQTMRFNHGIGLAAPQIGFLQRIIVMEYRVDNQRYKSKEIIPFFAIINPHIFWRSEKLCALEEGCLSLPSFRDVVQRPVAIKVRGLNEDGKKIEINAKGLKARVIQHEVDHLNGILFTDYLKEKTKK